MSPKPVAALVRTPAFLKSPSSGLRTAPGPALTHLSRILAAARRPAVRVPALFRYAAAFLAGVVVTLALTGGPGPGAIDPVPGEPAAPSVTTENPTATVPPSPRVPRRIR